MGSVSAIFGGNWNNGSNCGSRSSNWNNYPWNSNNNIGARGRCDNRITAPHRPRPCGQITSRWSAGSSCFGEHITGSGIAGSRRLETRGRHNMVKKHHHLIDAIVADQNMREALKKTSRAKRLTTGYLEFKEYAEANLAALADEMRSGTYKPAPHREFMVFEPKPRLISAPCFRDRIAQHALAAVVGPIFEAALLPRTFACRVGMGTHAGVRALQADMRRYKEAVYYLKTDFSKFFHSIDRAVLTGMIRRKIGCPATLKIIEAITPPEGVGIPIGNLTSQLWANVYAGAVDRWLQFDQGERLWFRYMDDIVVLGRDLRRMRELKDGIEVLASDRLHLRLSKWSIGKVANGVDFLGYRIWRTHKLLRKQSVTKAKRKIAAFQARGDSEGLGRFLASWRGHASWADTHNLMVNLGLEEDYADHQYTRRS